MVYLKIIHRKDQLWTVIAGLLSVLLIADPFYSPDFNHQQKLQSLHLDFFASGAEDISFYHPGNIPVVSTFARVGYSIPTQLQSVK